MDRYNDRRDRRPEGRDRKQAKRLYIGNIHEERDKKELKNLFQKQGEVIAFHCYEDEAYVEYEEPQEAERAIEELNGTKYMEKRLLVEWAHLGFNEKSYRPPRNRDDIQCYNCKGYGHI